MPARDAGALDRTAVVQRLLGRIDGRTYLEIGVGTGRNLRAIRARTKLGVDPAPVVPLAVRLALAARNLFGRDRTLLFETTSDRFFRDHADRLRREPVDVALVDGLHTYAQALRDVLGCLACLSPGGAVVMHDCNPSSDVMGWPGSSVEEVEALGLPGWDTRWCGDVWKSVVHLRSLRRDLRVFVLDCDFGVGVVTVGHAEAPLDYTQETIGALTYADLAADRARLLNLKPPAYLADFLDTLPARTGTL